MNDPAGARRQARVWRMLVGLQIAAVAAVVVAIAVVWVIGLVGSDFASR